MTIPKNCSHHPWPTQFWLFFAVLSNSTASIIIFTTFLQTPFSYIASVIYIICYRHYFDIKPDNMPIVIDLCFSLLSQTIVEYKNWEFALSFSLFLNLAVFYGCCVATHVVPEYFRLIKLNPKKEPTVQDMVLPLSVDLWSWAVGSLHVFQGLLLILMWVFPFGKWVYGFFQTFVGYFLVDQSVNFLKCYRDMVSKSSKKTE